MSSAPSLRPVVAVIPVFNAPADLADRLVEIAAQVERIVLVDDGTHSLSASPLASNDGIDLIELDHNGGIARALNVGIRRAIAGGAASILTLDQDSALDPGYVEAALGTIETAQASGDRVAFAVPAIVGGAPILRGRSAEGEEIAFDPIQSGAVIPVDVIETVGGFAESLFIDAVDSDFTLRARHAGYEIVIIEGTVMGHALGDLVPITFFGRALTLGGRPRHVIYHSPFRTYYMVRNSIYLMQAHGRGNVAWHAKRWSKLGSMIVAAIILAPGRGQQIRAAQLGARDGLRRRYGKVPAATLARIANRTRASKRA